MIKAVEEYLREMLNEEPTEASIIMIWSLNGQEKIDQAVTVLLKYLNNIISSPDEAKFRRIRTSNKVFKVSQLSFYNNYFPFFRTRLQHLKAALNFSKRLDLLKTISVTKTEQSIRTWRCLNPTRTH